MSGSSSRIIAATKSVARRVLHASRDVRLFKRTFEADAAVVSYPKAGRTWLRYIISNYLNDTLQLGLTVDLHTVFQVVPNHDLEAKRGIPCWRFASNHNVPLVVISHQRYGILRYHLLSLIFLVRDPRDLMVSAYHHHKNHKHRFVGTISEFLRDPTYGIDDLIAYLNSFGTGLVRNPHLVVSYEELTVDPTATLEAVLAFLDLPLDPDALQRAIAASRFEAMQETEIATGIEGHDYDRSNPDSRRMRRGKIGGFRDDLSDDDVRYIEQRCRASLNAQATALLQRHTGFYSRTGQLPADRANERQSRTRAGLPVRRIRKAPSPTA